MKIAVSGASGFVGSHIVKHLTQEGHEVLLLVRGKAGVGQVIWDPEKGDLDARRLEGIDAVINLSGENVAGRWTASKKRAILQSRVQATRTWVAAVKGLATPPKVFINASAVGYYGDGGKKIFSESSPKGNGFLADVCQQWEEELDGLKNLPVRVVPLRFGVILSAEGGALSKMLLPFKLGLGGIIGSGEQYMGWIDIEDVVRIISHVLSTDSLEGPINVVAPTPVTNREFTKALGLQLHRPTILPMPAFAARLVFGEMADEMLLSSIRVSSKKLEPSGFVYKFPTLETSFEHLL